MQRLRPNIAGPPQVSSPTGGRPSAWKASLKWLARIAGAPIVCLAVLGCGPQLPTASPAITGSTVPTELPTPSPTASSTANGSCQGVVPDLCAAALAEAEANGLFPASGQVVLSWVARPTRFKICDGIIVPKVDVVFTTRNPTVIRTITVGLLPDGRLATCTY
jgi:hypothetical protein